MSVFHWQVFKSNKTAMASGRYLNDAILQSINDIQRLLIYDRSVQPTGKASVKSVSEIITGAC